MKNILVIGSANMDLTIFTDRMPKLGETVRGYDFSLNCGGKGANQAVAAAKLGGSVSFIGALGKDAYGETLLGNFKQNNIRFEGFVSDKVSTGTASITVVGGDNFIILNEGANGIVTPELIEEKADLIKEADFLIMQLEIPAESVARAAEIAKSGGTAVVINPAPMKEMPDSLFAATDIMIPNEHEAELLTGIEVRSKADAERAIKAIKSKGVGTVIITLGEKGCVYNVGEEIFEHPAENANVVDTTSAGDTFIGALCVKLSEGESIHNAVSFASKAAAITVSRKGASASIPYAYEIK